MTTAVMPTIPLSIAPSMIALSSDAHVAAGADCLGGPWPTMAAPVVTGIGLFHPPALRPALRRAAAAANPQVVRP